MNFPTKIFNKQLLVIFLTGFCFFSHAQQQKIVRLLNAELRKEMAIEKKSSDRKVIITKPFHIENKNTLVFEYITIDNSTLEKIKRRQEVELDKIISIDKKYHVTFQTSGIDVRDCITKTDKNGIEAKPQKAYLYFFFPFFYRKKDNEKFKIKLLKAFKESGYSVSSEYWVN